MWSSQHPEVWVFIESPKGLVMEGSLVIKKIIIISSTTEWLNSLFKLVIFTHGSSLTSLVPGSRDVFSPLIQAVDDCFNI